MANTKENRATGISVDEIKQVRERLKRYKQTKQTRAVRRHNAREAALKRRNDVELLLCAASQQEGV